MRYRILDMDFDVLLFVLDDSLRLHEYFGDVLVEFFNIQPALGLRADDFGEMLTVLLIGLVFLPVIIWA